jgi:hypothetical protein
MQAPVVMVAADEAKIWPAVMPRQLSCFANHRLHASETASDPAYCGPIAPQAICPAN